MTLPPAAGLRARDEPGLALGAGQQGRRLAPKGASRSQLLRLRPKSPLLKEGRHQRCVLPGRERRRPHRRWSSASAGDFRASQPRVIRRGVSTPIGLEAPRRLTPEHAHPTPDCRTSIRNHQGLPAMVPWRATEEGFVSDAVVAWYERLARGRPGAIVVEATGVRDVPSGPLLRVGRRTAAILGAAPPGGRREASERRPDAAGHSDHRFPRDPSSSGTREVF